VKPSPEGELSLIERGRVLAAVRLLGPVAASARFRSPAAQRLLQVLSDPASRAREVAVLAASRPAHVERVHPSWYRAPPVSRVPAARRWLERSAYGRLVDMEPHQGTPLPRSAALLEHLVAGELDRLLAVLVAIGRRRVAVAFTGAPRSALAQLLARIGEPEASALAAEVRAVPPGVSAEEVKAAQRALFRSGPEPQHRENGTLFFQRVGCGWLAPLAEPFGDRTRRLAQRLPRALGEIVLRERRQPMGDAERASLWRALQQA
jgi:hypothetical protein